MPRRHRSHSIEFKRQVVAEYHAGETLHGLAKRHDICRNLIRVWVEKAELGAFDDETATAELLTTYEMRIAALESLVGRQALEIELSQRGRTCRTLTEKRAYIRDQRPRGLSVQRGCELMGVSPERIGHGRKRVAARRSGIRVCGSTPHDAPASGEGRFLERLLLAQHGITGT